MRDLLTPFQSIPSPVSRVESRSEKRQRNDTVRGEGGPRLTSPLTESGKRYGPLVLAEEFGAFWSGRQEKRNTDGEDDTGETFNEEEDSPLLDTGGFDRAPENC